MGSVDSFIATKKPLLSQWERGLECVSDHHASSQDPEYSIAIPIHGREGAEMIDSLGQYAHTDLIRRHIRLVLIVNNGSCVQRKQVSDMLLAQLDSLSNEVSYSLYCAKDDRLFQTISEIRLCLSLLSLHRLQSLSEDRLPNHFLITHDIDMLNILLQTTEQNVENLLVIHL